MIKRAFEQGFYKRASEYGISKEAFEDAMQSLLGEAAKGEAPTIDPSLSHLPSPTTERIRTLGGESSPLAQQEIQNWTKAQTAADWQRHAHFGLPKGMPMADDKNFRGSSPLGLQRIMNAVVRPDITDHINNADGEKDGIRDFFPAFKKTELDQQTSGSQSLAQIGLSRPVPQFSKQHPNP